MELNNFQPDVNIEFIKCFVLLEEIHANSPILNFLQTEAPQSVQRVCP